MRDQSPKLFENARIVDFRYVEVSKQNFVVSGPKIAICIFLQRRKRRLLLVDILIRSRDIRAQSWKLSENARPVDFG